MTRLIAKLMMWLLAAAALLFLCDFAVWRIRVASGGGMGSVKVGMLQVVPMKGNKEEWLPDGEQMVDCSKSVFPQAGAGACWWVERHRTVFER